MRHIADAFRWVRPGPSYRHIRSWSFNPRRGWLRCSSRIGPSSGLYMNSQHKDPKTWDPSFVGDGIAHWEGDVLVADIVNQNGQGWIDDSGVPTSEKLHVVQRWRKVGSRLEVTLTIDDPVIFTRSWMARMTYAPRPGLQVEDGWVCDEPHRSVANVKGAAAYFPDPKKHHEVRLMSTRNRTFELRRVLASCILTALVASALLVAASSVVAAGQGVDHAAPGQAPLIPGKGPRDFDAQWSPANPQLYADWKFPDDVLPSRYHRRGHERQRPVEREDR